MKIEYKTYVYFDSLLKKVEDKESKSSLNRLLIDEIALSSRKYIRADKVRPELKPSTIKSRKSQGISGTTPLLATGNLTRSIKATGKGISFANYGRYHRKGYTTAKGADVPAREFISIKADEKEKSKIISKVRKRYVKLINKNLRKR